MRYICKLFLLLAVTSVLASCPDPTTGKIDPYLTAKTSISFTKSSLSLADAVFENVLAYAKITGDKAVETRAKYKKVKESVIKFLGVAEESVNIAEKAGKGVSVVAIMADTDKAWKALREFIVSLMPSTTSTASTGTSGPPKPNVNRLPYSVIR